MHIEICSGNHLSVCCPIAVSFQWLLAGVGSIIRSKLEIISIGPRMLRLQNLVLESFIAYILGVYRDPGPR